MCKEEKMREYNLAELDEKKLEELLKLAKDIGLKEEDIDVKNKQNIIFNILEAQAKKMACSFPKGCWNVWKTGSAFCEPLNSAIFQARTTFMSLPPRFENFTFGQGTQFQGLSDLPKKGKNILL